MMQIIIIALAVALLIRLLYSAFSPKRGKAKRAVPHQRTKEEDFISKSFLRAESAYRHQVSMMHRYAYGEEVTLGDIVDFLVGKDTAMHLTGLSICATGDEKIAPERHEYTGDPQKIKEENLLQLVAYKNAAGKVKAFRKRNATLTLLRDNGKPIVLFVRNMVETPYLHYVRIYSMTWNDNASERQDHPVFNSTLICCKVTDKQADIDKRMDFYKRVEENVRYLMRLGAPLKNNFQYQILEGKYGRKPIAVYMRNGNYYFSENRYVDALRQYVRVLNELKTSKENTLSGEELYHLYYNTGYCLIKEGHTLSSFFYMNEAYRYDSSRMAPLLFMYAGTADKRTLSLLHELKEKMPEDTRQLIMNTYKGCCDARVRFLEEYRNYMTMGKVLEIFSLAFQHNISGMTISRNKGEIYEQETVKNAGQVWAYPLKECLQAGNTITINFSLTGEQYGTEGDKSGLCPDNSIIMHVMEIKEDPSLVRVDIMIPAFVYDPDKLSVTKDYLTEHKSFVIAKSPVEFDFRKGSPQEVVGVATELYRNHRTMEALFGATCAFAQLSAHTADPKLVEKASDVAGNCYRELGCYDKAEYFVHKSR